MGHRIVSLVCSGQVVKKVQVIFDFFFEIGSNAAQAGLNL